MRMHTRLAVLPRTRLTYSSVGHRIQSCSKRVVQSGAAVGAAVEAEVSGDAAVDGADGAGRERPDTAAVAAGGVAEGSPGHTAEEACVRTGRGGEDTDGGLRRRRVMRTLTQ